MVIQRWDSVFKLLVLLSLLLFAGCGSSSSSGSTGLGGPFSSAVLPDGADPGPGNGEPVPFVPGGPTPTLGPTAVADSYNAATASALTVGVANGVLANDTVNGASISAYTTASSQGGTVALNLDGSFTYTSATGYLGTDTFTYTLTNSSGSSSATVTLTVTGTLPAPITVNDGYGINYEDNVFFAASFGVLANDTPNGGTVTDFDDTGVFGGSVDVMSDGSFHYAAPSGFVGQDSFTYTVSNGSGSSTATVTIDIAAPNLLQAISILPSGETGDGASSNVSLSNDGMFAVFESFAQNLDVDATIDRDIFLADTSAGTLALLNLGTGGTQPSGRTFDAKITPDARYISFTSLATNLVTPDTNADADVFLYDQNLGTVEMISISTGGVQSNDGSYQSSVSDDGRFVVFSSNASNLAVGGPTGVYQIYLRDRMNSETVRISESALGLVADGGCTTPRISGDGTTVVFESDATNLVSGDTNGVGDIFVYHIPTDTMECVSLAVGGVASNAQSFQPFINGDGQLVGFSSEASDLVIGDTNGAVDVFLRDRTSGDLEVVNVTSLGAMVASGQSGDISDDGQFVVYSSTASNLVLGDTNGVRDVFVRDRSSGGVLRVSSTTAGVQGNGASSDPNVSPDGRKIGFVSSATNFTPPGMDDNGIVTDVFMTSNPFLP